MKTGSDVARGASYVLRGFTMWRRRPWLMLLGVVPALIVLLVVGAGLVALFVNVGDLVGWLTGFADDWADLPRDLLRVGLGILLVLGSLFVATTTFTGLTLIIGDPFYERIWLETERMLGGEPPGQGLDFWRSVRDGLVLTAYGVFAGLVVLVLGLLPVIGAVIGAVLGLVVSGRLLAGELVSRPLEARGLDRRGRRDLLSNHGGKLFGFGVVTQLFFLVPLGAVVVMPAAVAGATMLARDVLPEGPA